MLLPVSGLRAEGSAPQFHSRVTRYRIQAGDVVELVFRFTPEFNQTVTVQPDGFIPLHTAGEINIAGLTVAETQAAIGTHYASILHAPVITVILKDFNKPSILVGGEVARPGRFDLRGETTLSEAITMAGGLNLTARKTDVLLFRRVSKEVAEVKRINLKSALEKGMLAEDVYLQPGDSIYVSRSLVGKLERFMSISRLGLYFNPIPLR